MCECRSCAWCEGIDPAKGMVSCSSIELVNGLFSDRIVGHPIGDVSDGCRRYLDIEVHKANRRRIHSMMEHPV